jgi:hypothetical protein
MLTAALRAHYFANSREPYVSRGLALATRRRSRQQPKPPSPVSSSQMESGRGTYVTSPICDGEVS